MALAFYPHHDDTQKGSLADRIEVLMDAAIRYKAIVLDTKPDTAEDPSKRRLAPRDLVAAYNWEEIALLLQQIRELTEVSALEKSRKAELLKRLAEVYEVLRAAKMSKLEAVRLALISEANQLSGGAQVA